jgi:mannonate dehydratase
MGLGVAGALGLGSAEALGAPAEREEETTDQKYAQATNGMPEVKVTGVKAIPVHVGGTNLVTVKVETDEPGLYGLGDATFTQRAHAVVTAVNEYLGDFAEGRPVGNIENMWQSAYQSSYWRNGPVLNNALSGLDQALWDIKGKRAGMPVYELLGGKSRFAVPAYEHAGGSTPKAAAEDAQRLVEEGFEHVRIQLGGYGGVGGGQPADFEDAGFGRETDILMDPDPYLDGVPKMFARARELLGGDVELLHDVHERVEPMDALDLVKELEQYDPFFIEDPLSPENNRWFEMIRDQTHVPIAMGELYNNPHEWVRPISERWIDFIRIHVSQIGGITPAMKVARLGEWFNVKTAWHGPGDVAPVGHAANAHVDLAVWNFGIQEAPQFAYNPDSETSQKLHEIFPTDLRVEDGYIHVPEEPGLGVEVNEDAAAEHPLPEGADTGWTQIRRPDGTIVRP